MTAFVRRALATVVAVAAGCFGLIAATSACHAPTRNVPPANLIVIPPSEQVPGTIGPMRMDWLRDFAGTSAPTGR